MTNLARYLITTADERTWKFDRPVVFLGEWCRLYNRKHVWQDMDAIVAAPYGLGQEKKDVDHAEARALEEELFPRLCNVLNRHHGTQHGLRFWRIVLGHWLRRYVDVMLNRVRTLEQCLRTYQLTGTTGFEARGYSLATQDSYSAIWAFSDERWNNELNVRILNILGEMNFPIDFIEGCKATGFQLCTKPQSLKLKRRVLNWVRRLPESVSRHLVGADDNFIINTYLPKVEEIKLQIAMTQCPQVWSSPTVTIKNSPNSVLRRELTEQINIKAVSSLDRIVTAMALELLPVCYLEGFKSVKSVAMQQFWPKNSKVIFTSNNFDTDEVFKFWTATKTEQGSKYIVGQHGNNYGTYRYMKPSVEEATSDKFITWGWTDDLPQHTPAFLFKTAGKTTGKYDSSGGLLLIQVCLNHQITTWDGNSEFSDYFIEQQNLISKLDNSIKNKTTVRLHAGFRRMKWSEEARWNAFDPTLQIDTGIKPISELVARSRLIVHSYDSTGILETLSQNIPTLAFWQNDLDHLRENAKPYYQLLVDAGVIHLSVNSVANKINEIWNNTENWWMKPEVQDARIQFCKQYARTCNNPTNELLKALN